MAPAYAMSNFTMQVTHNERLQPVYRRSAPSGQLSSLCSHWATIAFQPARTICLTKAPEHFLCDLPRPPRADLDAVHRIQLRHDIVQYKSADIVDQRDLHMRGVRIAARI
jgi:hypothetical protein